MLDTVILVPVLHRLLRKFHRAADESPVPRVP
jgi:hypothetical protein